MYHFIKSSTIHSPKSMIKHKVLYGILPTKWKWLVLFLVLLKMFINSQGFWKDFFTTKPFSSTGKYRLKSR